MQRSKTREVHRMDKRLENFLKKEDSFSIWLQSLGEKDSTALALIVESLKPSANQLKDFASLAREISKRDDSSIELELSVEEITETIQSQRLSRNDKLSNIRDILLKKRFPERARLEAKLKELQNEIRKKYGLRVEYPKDLEGSRLSLSLAGKSADDFADLARSLESLSKSDELREILSLLLGE